MSQENVEAFLEGVEAMRNGDVAVLEGESNRGKRARRLGQGWWTTGERR